MNEIQSNNPSRQATINGLAVVGFVALIVAAMWLAVYSTRYVPTVVGRIGAAAVYLGSVFTPAPDSNLTVVPNPTASTTISFGTTASSTDTDTTTTPAKTTPKKVVTSAGAETNNTYQINGTAASTGVLSGLPDLTVVIKAVGYLATTSATSFVPSSFAPIGTRPAVNFIIKNIGTNMTGEWRFVASIPAQNAYSYQSQPQQTLGPGDSIEYTLGFDQANVGTAQVVSITTNSDKSVTESNFDNNGASAKINILGY